MQDLSRSIQDAPSADELTNRGVIHCFHGDLPSAMNDYQHALTFDPTYSLAHYNIGNLLLYQHHFRLAIRYFRTTNQDVLLLFYIILYRSYDCALKCGSHDDAVQINRGLCHMMLGEKERALNDLSVAISNNPYAAHAYFNRANINRSLGNLEEAQCDYRKGREGRGREGGREGRGRREGEGGGGRLPREGGKERA